MEIKVKFMEDKIIFEGEEAIQYLGEIYDTAIGEFPLESKELEEALKQARERGFKTQFPRKVK